MDIEVGSYEAKTKLPELLRGVQAGNRYTITLRGKAVAVLVPVGSSPGANIGNAVAQMQRFIASQPAMGGVNIKDLLEDGRD